MKNEQHVWTITLGLIAVILGVAVFKQFDFEAFKFKKTGLGILYLLTFLGVVTFLVRSRKGKG